ncbi:MAG: tRNA (adenosine(37)-N6)-dimethylallyltransferase MiaA [Desulfotomaculaceae bacterium]|nr:tRNA (adenosine(37)-N6)-dimethylallyltransferase MiaA [Desulfotomaculaceae bacterium]
MKDKADNKMKPLIVITGPTATGKSEVGVLVAEQVGGEIISADSMLLYRHMDIGTAKPNMVERHGIPHHMIDIAEPDQEYSAALYQKEARHLITEISIRRNLPILVGGTGLYIRAVIDPYEFGDTGSEPAIRERLLLEAEQDGYDKLHRRLFEVDPEAAAKLHPRDARRVIRALEVYYMTGRPSSSYTQLNQYHQPLYRLFMFGLNMERASLYRRIEKRVDAMIAAGLVEEVHQLLESGYSRDLNAMRSLGYKEIAAYLTGEISMEQAVELLKRNTRRFAKRQLTWFRRDDRIRWLDIDDFGSQEAIAKEITKSLEGVF